MSSGDETRRDETSILAFVEQQMQPPTRRQLNTRRLASDDDASRLGKECSARACERRVARRMRHNDDSVGKLICVRALTNIGQTYERRRRVAWNRFARAQQIRAMASRKCVARLTTTTRTKQFSSLAQQQQQKVEPNLAHQTLRSFAEGTS